MFCVMRKGYLLAHKDAEIADRTLQPGAKKFRLFSFVVELVIYLDQGAQYVSPRVERCRTFNGAEVEIDNRRSTVGAFEGIPPPIREDRVSVCLVTGIRWP